MTVFIYKDINGNQGITEGQAIASDIEVIWQGKKDQLQALGFNPSQVGGFELVNDSLSFNQALFDEAERKKQPPATGMELINFINNSTITALSDAEAFALVQKVQPFIMFLQQGRCNPLSEETFRTALGLLDQQLENGSKKIVIDLVTEWTKDKVFAPSKAPKKSK